MANPTLHLIAPFYSQLTEEWLHDGFTEKALNFSEIVQPHGWQVWEYSAGDSQSAATRKISIMDAGHHAQFFPQMTEKDTRPKAAIVGSPGWHEYNERVYLSLRDRVKDGDVICHVYGDAHKDLVKRLPGQHHLEIGIGYASGPFGAHRIFESNSWRHWHFGRYETEAAQRTYSWVIPNGHDEQKWGYRLPGISSNDRWALYFGRMDEDKGTQTIVEIMRTIASRGVQYAFNFAGRGDFAEKIAHQVEREPCPDRIKDGHFVYINNGVIAHDKRDDLLTGTDCLLAPTQYVEPFGNCVVQALMSGTPVLCSAFGGIAESVRHGIDGYHCRTLGDWIEGLENVLPLDRIAIAAAAKERFGFKHCGALYHTALSQITELSGPGWYSQTSHQHCH